MTLGSLLIEGRKGIKLVKSTAVLKLPDRVQIKSGRDKISLYQ
jgi:hypothetical protein